MRRVGFVLGVLVMLIGALAPALAQQPFADVPLDHWAYNAVNKLAETGLIEGYPDGTFKGKQPLTRYEFAQAIARIMDRVEQLARQPGPPGPPGPAGPAAGVGLTAEQQALLDRLAKEFAPELKALRSDLDNLTKRVEDLEAKAPPKGPVITVGGDINIRGGAYGTDLGFEDTSTTGYPFTESLVVDDAASWGGINLPDFDSVTGLWGDQSGFPGGLTFIGSIPISDALKDSFKASDFLTMRTRVNLAGQLNENTSVKVQLLADPRTNFVNGDLLESGLLGSPNFLSGNGVMDNIKVNEAYVDYRGHLLLPVNMVLGKQYVKRGVGLLADNDQEAVKGARFDWNKDERLSWGIYLGLLDREQFLGTSTGVLGLPSLTMYGAAGMYEPETSGQDNYNLYYADFAISNNWNLGLSWLHSGFNEEQGWSANLAGKAFGLDWYGEFAELRRWPTGEEFADTDGNGVESAGDLQLDDAGDNAWLAGAKWAGNWVSLAAEYGEVEAGYAISPDGAGWDPLAMGIFNLPLSALHPLAEVNAHYINWVDRPLFLDPTNIARGWRLVADFPKLLGSESSLKVSYASGDAYNPQLLSWLLFGGPASGIRQPDEWVDADPIWTVQLCRRLSDNVTAKLLYGRREVDNVMSTQQVPFTRATVGQTVVNVFAEDDPIQVIRAELAVGF